MLRQINSDIDSIDDYYRAERMIRPSDVDLVLELCPEADGSFSTLYYLADHSKRCIFFVDEFDTVDLPAWNAIKGMTCSTHLGTLVL